MNPINGLFQRLRLDGRKAFIPFLTAGDPDLEATAYLARKLEAHGADLLEIGFPYSDPIADGPVIQASYNRALASGLRIDDVFSSVRRLGLRIPVVGMVSYSLVYRRGPRQFVAQCQEAGLSGLIVPDLPVDESEEVAQIAAAREFKLIQLVTPTTPRDRAVRIASSSTGFLYYVSITGITGERASLPEELVDQLKWLRSQTHLPLCVGFGISKPEHVRQLRDVVDGVIVGSAIVRRVEQLGSRSLADVAGEIGQLASALVQALRSDS